MLHQWRRRPPAAPDQRETVPCAFRNFTCKAKKVATRAGIAQLVERILGKDEVPSSSLGVSSILCTHSSVGRALALQARGRRFEPVCVHH